MAYFWVNQGATYPVESRLGLLWAPEQTLKGHRRSYWDSLLAVVPGDVIFNYANGYLLGYAEATSGATPLRPRPYNAGAPYAAAQGGQAVFCSYHPAEKAVPLAAIVADRNLKSALQGTQNPVLDVNGDVAQKYLCPIEDLTGRQLISLLAGAPSSASPPIQAQPTTKQRLDDARVGQGRFRADLLLEFNYRCAVTGLAIPALLRASHIKAWCLSTDSERLDPNNGLLLAAGVDAAFDRGFVSFSAAGRLLVNSDLTPADRASLGIPGAPVSLALELRTPTRMALLEHHRSAFGL